MIDGSNGYETKSWTGMRSIPLFLLTTFALFLIIPGCSNNLDRSKAQAKLKKEYPRQVIHSIALYGYFPWDDSCFKGRSVGYFTKAIGNMQKDGYIRQVNCHNGLKPTPSVSVKLPYVETWIELSDKAKPFVRKTQMNNNGKMEMATFEVGKEVFNAITGITGSETGFDSHMRAVQYTTRIELNEIGKSMGLKEQIKEKEAIFQKYDDGWRLVND